MFKTYRLKKWWGKYERFWVTKRDGLSESLLKEEKTYWGFFPEQRNIPNMIRNLGLAWKILAKEKPEVIFSSGAGIAVPFLYLAKLLGIKVVFMETFTFKPMATLSGRMIYPIADLFVVQNKKLREYYPKAQYWGKVI